ncbi:MAG: hypothetical protein R3E86_17910 [Pseudomonadales bacterium]
MKNLVGQCFSLADGRYRIVDVRRVGGDAMIYAEELQREAQSAAIPATPHSPRRAAFHYGDIAELLSVGRTIRPG